MFSTLYTNVGISKTENFLNVTNSFFTLYIWNLFLQDVMLVYYVSNIREDKIHISSSETNTLKFHWKEIDGDS
jgi:hypothetical protein